jgi:PST family polysaccharide transporter
MQFRKLAIRRLVATVSGGIVGITLALMGYGLWSLVAQQLVGRFVDCLVLYWVTPWYPRFRFSFARLNDMLGFGGKVMGTNITQFINTQVDRLLIGHFLGMGALGIYVVGRRIVDVLLRTLVSVLNRVAFSAFSRMQPSEQLSAFLLSTRRAAFFSLPMFALLIVTAEPVTILVFGDKWETAGMICRLVALSALVQSLVTFASPLLKAAGQPGKVFISLFLRSLVSVCLAYLASPYGLLPMVAAWIVGEMLSPMMLAYWLWVVKRVSPVKMIGSLRFILFSAGLAALIGGWMLTVLASSAGMSIQILSVVFVFIPIYLLMIRKLEPDEFRLATSWVRKLNKGDIDGAHG